MHKAFFICQLLSEVSQYNGMNYVFFSQLQTVKIIFVQKTIPNHAEVPL